MVYELSLRVSVTPHLGAKVKGGPEQVPKWSLTKRPVSTLVPSRPRAPGAASAGQHAGQPTGRRARSKSQPIRGPTSRAATRLGRSTAGSHTDQAAGQEDSQARKPTDRFGLGTLLQDLGTTVAREDRPSARSCLRKIGCFGHGPACLWPIALWVSLCCYTSYFVLHEPFDRLSVVPDNVYPILKCEDALSSSYVDVPSMKYA
jgi:hypothetical protein